MQIKFEKSVVAELRNLGLLSQAHDTIMRQGIAPGPEGSRSYRVGIATIVARYEDDTLIVDRLALDTVHEADCDLLTLDEIRALCNQDHPLRVMRKHRGLSAAALSQVSGVPTSSINDYETRKTKHMAPAKLQAIAKALAMNISDITEIQT